MRPNRRRCCQRTWRYSFLSAWGRGQAIGNGSTECVAAAIGKVTSEGTQWSFDLDAGGYHGVMAFAYDGSGIRGLVVVAVPQARSAKGDAKRR